MVEIQAELKTKLRLNRGSSLQPFIGSFCCQSNVSALLLANFSASSVCSPNQSPWGPPRCDVTASSTPRHTAEHLAVRSFIQSLLKVLHG